MADVLGSSEQAVLLAILRLGDGAYDRAILYEAVTRLEREVAAGAVHATEQPQQWIPLPGDFPEPRAGIVSCSFSPAEAAEGSSRVLAAPIAARRRPC